MLGFPARCNVYLIHQQFSTKINVKKNDNAQLTWFKQLLWLFPGGKFSQFSAINNLQPRVKKMLLSLSRPFIAVYTICVFIDEVVRLLITTYSHSISTLLDYMHWQSNDIS